MRIAIVLGLRGGEGAEALRVLALLVDALLGGPDLAGDVLVLDSDRLHVVGLRDQVGKAPGGEEYLQGAQLAAFVEIDQAVSEPFDQRVVLVAVELEALGLDAVELVQPVELLLVQREVALEGREPHGDDAYLGREVADLAVDRCDVGGELALALLGAGDIRLDGLEPRIDRLLPAGDVTACGSGDDREEQHDDRKESVDAHLARLRRSDGRPCPGALLRVRRRARYRARLRHDGRAGRLGRLRPRFGNRHRLWNRARLRIRLGDRLRRLDLGGLHLELRSLDSLHRASGRLLHLFLLCGDQPVQLCHPRTG